jgi:predicted nucleic acid-binding protein
MSTENLSESHVIFLDNCCLHRPHDDQSQPRIRLESDAVLHIIRMVEAKKLIWVGSTILRAEIESNANAVGRTANLATYDMLCDSKSVEDVDLAIAKRFHKKGFGPIDAVHLSVAERHGCKFLISTDDRFVKSAKRCKRELRVCVQNPLDWLRKNAHP